MLPGPMCYCQPGLHNAWPKQGLSSAFPPLSRLKNQTRHQTQGVISYQTLTSIKILCLTGDITFFFANKQIHCFKYTKMFYFLTQANFKCFSFEKYFSTQVSLLLLNSTYHIPILATFKYTRLAHILNVTLTV